MADVTASVVNLGNPVSGISGYGKCLRVLRAYLGRIYYGAGNASNSNRNPNTNGGVLKYWNPGTSAFVSTGVTPAEEQLDTMRIAINGDMIIPGIDSNADNVNAGWVRGVSGTFTKYNSVMANWSHCFDMVDFFDSVTSSLKMFAVGGVNGTASTVKVASGGVGTVSGDWADSTVLLNDPFRVFSAFVANGKVYFCHSVDQQINPNGAVIYEWVAGTTILATLKSAAVLKFADVFPSTSSSTYTDRTNTSGVAIVSAKIVRSTHFGTRTFYIGGEAVNDQQIDPYALYSVSDGSAGTGIDVATFAKITHPAVSGKTNLKPRDIWTDGSEIRVAYSYLDGSSNVCCSLISSTNGTTWTELFTLIPNGASGTAGGQTPVFAYEYLNGIHYFALGTDWFLTTDPAVQANVGEILAYDTTTGGPAVATKRTNALSWAVRPDSSNNVFAEPSDIKLTNDLYGTFIWVFKAAATKRTLKTRFAVPKDYVSAPKIVVRVASTTTSSNIQIDVDYRAIADGESFDPTTHQESVNSGAIALPGTALLVKDITINLTAGNFSPDDTVDMLISVDSATNVLGLLIWASFEYSDV